MTFPDYQPLSLPLKPNPLHTRELHSWKHASPLLGCRFDPAGRFVFAGAQDNSLQRWELPTGKKTALTGHQSWCRALAFQDRQLFSGDYAGKILCWHCDAETPTPLRELAAHEGWVRALAVSPDGKLLASCGNDNLVKLWSLPELSLVRTFAGHQRHAYNVAFHPDGKQLASCDLLGVVKHWDADTGKLVRDLDAAMLHKYDNTFRASIGGARSMTFSNDGTQLAVAGITNVSNAFAGIGNPMVVLFDWVGGKQLRQLKPQAAFQGTMWGVAQHPDGWWLGAGGGSGGALWFWKDQPESFHTFKLPSGGRDLSLHPDGSRLAVAHTDGALRVFDLLPKL